MTIRLEESLAPDAGYFLNGTTALAKGQTEFQTFEVYETAEFGRLLRLDGIIQLTERDEYLYHEPLIHMAGLALPRFERALILGGGDGGALEEVLKYKSLSEAVIVEIDPKVIELARTYFASVNQNAFDDPRTHLILADGQHYVRETALAQQKTFDLITLDLSDPVGPSAALYEEAFLADCKKLLSPDGILTLHLGPCYFQPERIAALHATVRKLFRFAPTFANYIPFYGGLWAFTAASDRTNIAACSEADITARLTSLDLNRIRFITGATYKALQALPVHLPHA